MALALAQSICDGTFFRLDNQYSYVFVTPVIFTKITFPLTQHLILAGKSDPTHLLGGAGIHTLSVTVDGGCQPVMTMVPYFTTKQVMFYPSEPPFNRRESREHHNSFVHCPLCETRSKYTLLHYSSNLEGNEHKQVTGYHEVSAFLLSPYISTLFPSFLSFTHQKASHGHSIIFYRSCF
jgi:hypothetical protein